MNKTLIEAELPAELAAQARAFVAEYLTVLPPRELLQQKLHAAIETSRARLDASELDGKEGGE